MVDLGAVGRDDVALVGGKGANLGELVQAGFAVPPGFVVTTDAYRASLAGHEVPEGVRTEILAAYAALGQPPVAVRSSATVEDLAGASFAGQLDTSLNVRGDDALLDAVRRCWVSLGSDRAVAYRAQQGASAGAPDAPDLGTPDPDTLDPDDVAVAVVVQEMVEADAAGVLFTANPANGRRQETVVAAAWGLGEAVVGGLVDTDSVVVRAPDGPVLSRSTADKAVRTVCTEGGTTEQEVPAAARGAAVLDDAAAIALTRLGAAVQAHRGSPQDIEWARRDGTFYLLQARPVTALPPPEADPPTDWSVPDPHAFYARASIVEQLPDPLTPLFADLVRPSVSRSLQALFRELVGDDVVREGDVDLPTVNGYAYYRYSLAGMGRLLLHSGGAFRTLLSPGSRGTEERWRSSAHPRYVAVVGEATAQTVADAPSAALVDRARALIDAGTAYYTAVQTVIPLAASGEVLLAWFYDHLVRGPGDPPVETFLLGFDSLPIRAEKSLWDLAAWTAARPALRDVVLSRPVAELVGGGEGPGEKGADGERPGQGEADLAEWRERFGAHLAAYGHLVYNLDPVNPVPADAPEGLVEAMRFWLRGEGLDPHVRQRTSAERREQAAQAVTGALDPVRGWAFRRLLALAQRGVPLREDALGDVGLAWPQLRRVLHELGRRLLDDPDAVFWVREAELEALVAGATVDDLTSTIERRQEVWRGQRRVVPPQVLPERGWLSHLFARVLPAVTAGEEADVLTGVAASAGRVTARARVLTGTADFASFVAGEVLVAAITTPAWTSLFPRAAAVVTDIGGPLSHSSIVAREYGIPAVLGTGSATRRIRTGDLVTVDGDAGRVELSAGVRGS